MNAISFLVFAMSVLYIFTTLHVDTKYNWVLLLKRNVMSGKEFGNIKPTFDQLRPMHCTYLQLHFSIVYVVLRQRN